MPTKRSQNIPGKAPRPSRNSHNRSAGVRGRQHARRSFRPQSSSTGLFHLCAQKPLVVRAICEKRRARRILKRFLPWLRPRIQPSCQRCFRKEVGPRSAAYAQEPAYRSGRYRRRCRFGRRASLATNALEGKKEATVESISVPEDAVNALSDYSQADYTQHVKAAGSCKLAYGTLVWADNDTVCCLPGARRIGKPVKHGKPAVPFQRQNRFGAFRCSRRRRRVRNRRCALQRKRHCLDGIERLRICLARIHRKAIQRQRHHPG